MKRFDADRDGVISFPEFVRMLSVKPWRELLSDADTERLDSMNAARARGMV